MGRLIAWRIGSPPNHTASSGPPESFAAVASAETATRIAARISSPRLLVMTRSRVRPRYPLGPSTSADIHSQWTGGAGRGWSSVVKRTSGSETFRMSPCIRRYQAANRLRAVDGDGNPRQDIELDRRRVGHNMVRKDRKSVV